MQHRVRNIVSFVVLGALLAAGILMSPEAAVSETQMYCTGTETKHFKDMTACSVRMEQGCSCSRGPNPWYSPYWLAVPVVLGGLAVFILKASWGTALGLLATSLVLSGGATLTYLHSSNQLDAEQLAFSSVNLLFLAVLSMASYAFTRYGVQYARKRRTMA